MVEATILHLELVGQAQQRRSPYPGVAFALLKVRLAVQWVGGFIIFPPSAVFDSIRIAQR